MTDTPPLTDQLLFALAAFDAAHHSAESAAAWYAEGKRRVGGNETERKERKSNTPPEDYAQYVAELPGLESIKNETAANLERAEKQLNVLREMLNHATSLNAVVAAHDFASAASELNRTVDAWRRGLGVRPTMLEIRRHTQPQTLAQPERRGMCDDCGNPLAVGNHDDCDLPF